MITMGVKIVVSDPATKKSYQLDVEKDKIVFLFGKKIGDEVNGDFIGLTGYTLQITGGSDKDGFPMHPSVEGTGRRRVLLKGPPGFHPKLKGERKRKTVRGNTISDDLSQVNVKVIKPGTIPLEQLVPLKSKDTEKEAKT
jgi:small subunit ribosomal protein S6e